MAKLKSVLRATLTVDFEVNAGDANSVAAAQGALKDLENLARDRGGLSVESRAKFTSTRVPD